MPWTTRSICTWPSHIVWSGLSDWMQYMLNTFWRAFTSKSFFMTHDVTKCRKSVAIVQMSASSTTPNIAKWTNGSDLISCIMLSSGDLCYVHKAWELFYWLFSFLFVSTFRSKQRQRQFHRCSWMTVCKDTWPRFSRPGQTLTNLSNFPRMFVQ